ncbi:MAG: Lrp/AsnC family transcriptional regulator [Sphingobacterium sp.]|jgi:DNA-binding Lrp family transcriptional regulator|nr:Lrp/AsnC family transcriptional regulator [Sphingobacterium sp.]
MMMDLDQTDLELLHLLQEDATMSKKELGLLVHKSFSVVHERIKRLKKYGYIKDVRAILDRDKIGIGLICFSQVFLSDHSYGALEMFENSVSQFPEVMECFQMSGSYDFLLHIATNDMESYQLFLRNKLAVLPSIDRIQSFFVLSEAKSDLVYPLFGN